LANRRLFQLKLEEALEHAQATQGSAGLLLLDLDHFKQINDTLGHDAGDMLLKMFAERLQSVMRPGDTIARFGGDEFALIISDLEGEQRLANVSQSILDRLREPFVHDGRVLDCRASIGASIYPADGLTSEALLKNADMALYSAKAAGRGTSIKFEPQLREEMQRRNTMIQLARNAVRYERIVPHYQPKLGLADGSVIGFEALLRWRDPNGRIHQPSTIEAAFEDLELAARISETMIERTIADMRRWLDDGILFGHVAVNAAAAEFRQDDFAERLLDRLQRADISTDYFQLEVTETVFLGRGAEFVHRALGLLSSAGIKIALDDFGTGYASLRHLKEFPVDIMKIDRSFVRDMLVDPSDEAIIRAVINLGRNLAIEVVAEGIETQEQAKHLIEIGCNHGQGFLFSEAVPADRVPSLVLAFGSRSALAGATSSSQGLRLISNSG
jgi:diguanylate cyclase (GGDEF)-like protein